MDRSHFVNEFEDMGLSISDCLIDKCVIACHEYKISARDFVGSWIAYCATKQIDANELVYQNLNILVKCFKKKIENKTNKKFQEDSNIYGFFRGTPSDFIHCSKPLNNEISVSDIVDGDNIKEENTSTAGDVACNFGRENVNKNDPSADVKTFHLFKQELWDDWIYCENDHQYEHCYYIQEMVNHMIKNNNLKPLTTMAELDVLGSDNNEEITISGILKAKKKDELYICDHVGYMRLDLSEAEQPAKSLFTNQIMVVTGINPEPKVFKARKLFTNAALPLSKTLPEFSQGNVNFVVAAGPFFNKSSPHGMLLKSLVQKTIELEAKLLILLGPIFDADLNSFFWTQLNKTFSENLQKCYDDLLDVVLKPLFSNPSTQNIKLLVFSSWKDPSCYAFYPTPPKTESLLPTLYPHNVFMVSDPCVFTVNGIVIAGNACDTLMDIHTSAINQTHEELFTKLAKQIIWQRSLHPSYDVSPSVPVDLYLWLQQCTLEQNTPHIILTSSPLRTFIRIVEGCMVINVGQLVKHDSQKKTVAGTYGKIQIAPPKNGCWSPQTNISAEIIHI